MKRVKGSILSIFLVFCVSAGIFLPGVAVGANERKSTGSYGIIGTQHQKGDSGYWAKFESSYYYGQLNAAEKQLYERLYSRCMQLLTGEENISKNIGFIGTTISNKNMMKVMFAFACSNPQFYFLSDRYVTGWNPAIGKCCTINVYSEFESGNERSNATKRLKDNLVDVLSKIDGTIGATAAETQFLREKLIYDYVIDTVSYDESVTMSQTCYSALVYKKSVCAGYAEAFELLCQYAGILTICVTSETHEWNQVQVDGIWYMVDSTWGDTSGNRRFYFNKSKKTLALGHTPESVWSNYNIPDCPSDYVYDLPVASYLYRAGIYMLQQTKDGIVCGMVTDASPGASLEYRWLGYSYTSGSWFVVQDWTLNNEWLVWNPGEHGDYLIMCEVKLEDGSGSVLSDVKGVNHHPQIKGICQMPYAGGGYLIGIESYENPNQSYTYEMLIYDCTLQTWVYSTGAMAVSSGKALWTVWKPQYGYYWTLFRIYDSNGNVIDQSCYGFANI